MTGPFWEKFGEGVASRVVEEAIETDTVGCGGEKVVSDNGAVP